MSDVSFANAGWARKLLFLACTALLAIVDSMPVIVRRGTYQHLLGLQYVMRDAERILAEYQRLKRTYEPDPIDSDHPIVWKINPRQFEHEAFVSVGNAAPAVNNSAQDETIAELDFDSGLALAHLLMNEVIILNDHWWREDLNEEQQKLTSLNVDCSDVFAWGCADAQELSYSEIPDLYRMWSRDPKWGAAVWCMVKRNRKPQGPVEAAIGEEGIWDLDSLKLGENSQERDLEAIFTAINGGTTSSIQGTQTPE